MKERGKDENQILKISFFIQCRRINLFVMINNKIQFIKLKIFLIIILNIIMVNVFDKSYIRDSRIIIYIYS